MRSLSLFELPSTDSPEQQVQVLEFCAAGKHSDFFSVLSFSV